MPSCSAPTCQHCKRYSPASIACNNFGGSELYNYEGYYASVIYSFFASLGTTLIAEDVTNTGRIDLTLRVPDETRNILVTYIFEFKVVDQPEDSTSALAQIKAKNYAQKYDGGGVADRDRVWGEGTECCGGGV